MNKKINNVFAIILLGLFCFPRITLGWYTDNFSSSFSDGLLVFFGFFFIFIIVPAFCIGLFITSIIFLIRKVKVNKRTTGNLSTTNSNPKNKPATIIAISIILIFGSSFFLYKVIDIYTSMKFYRERDELLEDTNNLWTHNCTEYFYSNYTKNFYQKYTVEKGDTLESISKKELGDLAKATDIITLHKGMYPNLSEDKELQTLETGLKLLLPTIKLSDVDNPSNISSGNFLGEIADKKPFNKETFLVVGGKENGEFYRTSSEKSKMINGKIQKGECIDIIMSHGNHVQEVRKQN